MATTDTTAKQQAANDSNTIPSTFSQSEMKNINPTVKTKMDKFNSFATKYKQLDSSYKALLAENTQLKIDNATLTIQAKNVQELEAANKTLTQELEVARKNETPIGALTSPSGCAVLIVLIIAITAIALRKGLSISKGDAKVSIGGDEKK